MRIVVNKSKCIGCEACIKKCPVEAIELLEKVAQINEQRCIKCKACIRYCLLDAIDIK